MANRDAGREKSGGSHGVPDPGQQHGEVDTRPQRGTFGPTTRKAHGVTMRHTPPYQFEE